MIVGIPREVPLGRGMEERRVGLSPAGVAELVEQGAKVLVEREAEVAVFVHHQSLFGLLNLPYQPGEC